MKYDEEEFFRLLAEVERQGGTYLDEVHDHVYFPAFTGKKTTEGQEPHGGITYCNCVALFDVPYVEQDKSKSPVEESIKVCAVDDCIGLWPRFSAAKAYGRDHSYLDLGSIE